MAKLVLEAALNEAPETHFKGVWVALNDDNDKNREILVDCMKDLGVALETFLASDKKWKEADTVSVSSKRP